MVETDIPACFSAMGHEGSMQAIGERACDHSVLRFGRRIDALAPRAKAS